MQTRASAMRGLRQRRPGRRNRKTLAKKVTALTRQVRSDDKYQFVTNTGQVLSQWSAGGYTLNAMARGTTDGTRVGDNIYCKYVDIKISLFSHRTNFDDSGYATPIRVMLIRTRDANGLLPVASELFTDASSAASILYSPQNPHFKYKYKLLHDKLYSMNSQAFNSVGVGSFMGINRNIVLRKKLGFQTTYTGNAGTSADIVKNGLYLFIFIEKAAQAAPGPYDGVANIISSFKYSG